MRCLLGLLFTVCLEKGLTDSCDGILDCLESSDTDWSNGIFCHSVFNTRGRLLYVNCSWLPYNSSLPSKGNGYKLHLVWPEYLECEAIDTHDTSMTLGKEHLRVHLVTTIWVSYTIPDQQCVKTKNFFIKPEVNCQSPKIQYAVHSGNTLRFLLDKIGQVRYREIMSSQWHTMNVTQAVVNVSLPGGQVPESFVMQQRCYNEFCFHCKWETETIVPHELLGAPDIIVTTEKLSPGKQRLTVEWTYTSHDYVDGYHVVIHRLPNSCGYNITLNTAKTEVHRNLSVAFFNVSVTAYNKAGRSMSASAVVPPLATPELPGKITATYKNNTIFLTWSPLFKCDFVVINWGTNYSQMESKILMHKIENYSIPGPFEAMKRYMIGIYLYSFCQCRESTEETTYGLTYIYSEEGVPRTGPRNVTVKNVTKTSAVIEWEEIPEDDCRGFLLGYRISYIDTSGNPRKDIFLNVSSQRRYQIKGLTGSHTYDVTVSGVTVTGAGAPSIPQEIHTLSYDEAEFRIIIMVTCVGLIISAVILVGGCAYTVRRAKSWYFPEIPNPKHSHIVKIREAAGTKNLLIQSSPCDEEESCIDQPGVEVTPQTQSILTEGTDNGISQKNSNYQRTHAHAEGVEQYTNIMSVPKVFQRMPESANYVCQQPPAVQK